MDVLKKVRMHLTLLFSGITAMILLIISAVYLLVAETNLKNNNFTSFQNDVNTIVGNLEDKTIIAHDWLAKLEAGNRYIIFVEDNDNSLLFGNIVEDAYRNELIQNIKAYYNENFAINVQSLYSAYHTEFTYSAKKSLLASNRESYYVSYVESSRNQGTLEMYILKPLKPVYLQIYKQRTLFIAIGIFALIVLYVFTFYFVKLLLKPIAENQKKQALFIASASHEFRTPLAVILSCVSAMKKEKINPSQNSMDFCQIIESETNRLAHLINDMLFLTNGKNPNQQLDMKDWELETIVLNSYESFEVMAREKGLTLLIDMPEHPMPLCTCNSEKIMQLLAILLHNAFSYTDKGKTVTLKTNFENDKHFIYVIDNGIGIPDSEKENIFENFYRVDTSRSKKDHFGLGLSIASEIVKMHNGNISVEDTPNGGATFVIRL